VEGDFAFQEAVVAQFGPSAARGFVHLVVAVPFELDGVALTGAMD
jgi:hypothetical protein